MDLVVWNKRLVWIGLDYGEFKTMIIRKMFTQVKFGQTNSSYKPTYILLLWKYHKLLTFSLTTLIMILWLKLQTMQQCICVMDMHSQTNYILFLYISTPNPNSKVNNKHHLPISEVVEFIFVVIHRTTVVASRMSYIHVTSEFEDWTDSNQLSAFSIDGTSSLMRTRVCGERNLLVPLE